MARSTMYTGVLPFLLIATTLVAAGRYGCPPRVQIRPCVCLEKSRGLDVSCENAHLNQLREALASIARTKQPIWYLKLRNNKLGNMASFILKGLDVRHLIAHRSNMSSVDTNAFESVSERLESLDLAMNSLEKVPSHALRDLDVLVSLNLNYNKLEILHAEAFKGLISLLRLSLYGNRIKFIDNLAFIGVGENLTRINLGGNRLTSVPSRPLRNLTHMQRLQLHENQIAALMSEEFVAMGGESLDVLDLANNMVSELPARAFVSLRVLNSLDLEKNMISNIHVNAFEGIEDSLEWLKLGENLLQDIPSQSLKNLNRLRQLDLRGNNISRIKDDDFMPYGKNLKFVYLQNNWLTTVDPTSFLLLNSLEWLYLQNNQLTSIPYETYSPVLNTLQVFDFHGNPIECDCKVAWFRDWIAGDGSEIVPTAQETKCEGPEEFHGITVQEIPDNQLPCNRATTRTFGPSSTFAAVNIVVISIWTMESLSVL